MKITITAPAGGIEGRAAQQEYIAQQMDRANFSSEGIKDASARAGGNRALAEAIHGDITARGGTAPKVKSIMRQVQRMAKGDIKNPQNSRYREAIKNVQDQQRQQQRGNKPITVTAKGKIRVSKDSRKRSTSAYDIPPELFDQVMEDPVGAFQGDIADSQEAQDLMYEPLFYPELENMEEISIGW